MTCCIDSRRFAPGTKCFYCTRLCLPGDQNLPNRHNWSRECFPGIEMPNEVFLKDINNKDTVALIV